MPQRVARRMRARAPHFAFFELPFFDPFFFFEGEPGAAALEAGPAGFDAASVLTLRSLSGFFAGELGATELKAKPAGSDTASVLIVRSLSGFFAGELGAAELEVRPAGSDAASVLILRPVSGFWMLPGFTRS